jgi:membrane-associated protease RseP (regulator of RpoE activity)
MYNFDVDRWKAFLVGAGRELRAPLELVFVRTPVGMFAVISLLSQSWRLGLVVMLTLMCQAFGYAVAYRWFKPGFKHVRFYGLVAFTKPMKPISTNVQLGYANLAGLVGILLPSALLLTLYWNWTNPVFALIVATVASIGLFNCAPLPFFSGGLILAVLVSRLSNGWQWIVTMIPLVVALAVILGLRLWGLLFFLILVTEIMAVQLWLARLKKTKDDEPEFQPLSRRHVAVLATCYTLVSAGLIAVCLAAVYTPGFSWTNL